jgi:FkbM family methyltransferase
MNLKLAVRNFVLDNPSLAIAGLASIKKIIRHFGFDLSDEINPKSALLSARDINLILDVGANTGQYGMRSRIDGYKGKIISFEPLASAFAKLCQKAQKDPLWLTYHLALGNYDGTTSMNVSKKSVFSSILPISNSLVRIFPDSSYVDKEEIKVKKLDTFFNDDRQLEDKIFLKIDTQGYEKYILEGAEKFLNKVAGIQLELSLKGTLYQGEFLMKEAMDFLSTKGFTLVALEPLSGMLKSELLQADAIFWKL